MIFWGKAQRIFVLHRQQKQQHAPGLNIRRSRTRDIGSESYGNGGVTVGVTGALRCAGAAGISDISGTRDADTGGSGNGGVTVGEGGTTDVSDAKYGIKNLIE